MRLVRWAWILVVCVAVLASVPVRADEPASRLSVAEQLRVALASDPAAGRAEGFRASLGWILSASGDGEDAARDAALETLLLVGGDEPSWRLAAEDASLRAGLVHVLAPTSPQNGLERALVALANLALVPGAAARLVDTPGLVPRLVVLARDPATRQHPFLRRALGAGLVNLARVRDTHAALLRADVDFLGALELWLRDASHVDASELAAGVLDHLALERRTHPMLLARTALLRALLGHLDPSVAPATTLVSPAARPASLATLVHLARDPEAARSLTRRLPTLFECAVALAHAESDPSIRDNAALLLLRLTLPSASGAGWTSARVETTLIPLLRDPSPSVRRTAASLVLVLAREGVVEVQAAVDRQGLRPVVEAVWESSGWVAPDPWR